MRQAGLPGAHRSLAILSNWMIEVTLVETGEKTEFRWSRLNDDPKAKSVRDIRAFRIDQWSDFTAVVKS